MNAKEAAALSEKNRIQQEKQATGAAISNIEYLIKDMANQGKRYCTYRPKSPENVSQKDVIEYFSKLGYRINFVNVSKGYFSVSW